MLELLRAFWAEEKDLLILLALSIPIYFAVFFAVFVLLMNLHVFPTPEPDEKFWRRLYFRRRG